MPKVFISYARDKSHGQNLATECQQELQTAGFEVFRDVIGLKPGDVWYSKLEFELETSDVVVLIVSEKVRRSKWVHNEVSMAEEIGLPVIPVFAEAVRSPLWLRHLQALDFALTTNWPMLIETVHAKGAQCPQGSEQAKESQRAVSSEAIPHEVVSTPGAPDDKDLPTDPKARRAAIAAKARAEAAAIFKKRPSRAKVEVSSEAISHEVVSTPRAPDDKDLPTDPKEGRAAIAAKARAEAAAIFEKRPSRAKVEITIKPKPIIATPSPKDRLIYLRDQYRESSPWASEVDIDDFGIYANLEVSGVIQRFRLIQPSTFWMGSPGSEAERRDNETYHQVTLSKAFWLADTACTQALWEMVMGNNPARFKSNPNNPVEQVSWNDIQAFIRTLNTMLPCLSVQLPTEAQWEYACRAGTNSPFSFGANITPEQVNYNGNNPYSDGEKGLDSGKTVSVKSLQANAWGLYEMHGNVWEWCQDAYKSDLGTEASTDPLNGSGVDRVLRGGSWVSGGGNCRSASRFRYSPSDRDSSVGFRLARGQ